MEFYSPLLVCQKEKIITRVPRPLQFTWKVDLENNTQNERES